MLPSTPRSSNRSLDFSLPTKILHTFVFSHTNATDLPAHPPCRKQQVIYMRYCCTVSYQTISWSHCSPVYSSMELGVELMSLEPSSKFLRFVISPGGSEPGPEANAEQINNQHRLVFTATGKKLQSYTCTATKARESSIGTAPPILSLSIRWTRVVNFTSRSLYPRGHST